MEQELCPELRAQILRNLTGKDAEGVKAIDGSVLDVYLSELTDGIPSPSNNWRWARSGAPFDIQLVYHPTARNGRI
jgi:hypothetical protein